MARAGNKIRKTSARIVRISILAVILFFILVPLWWAITISFNEKAISTVPSFSWWPEITSLKSYDYAFKTIKLVRLYANTLFITIVNVVISVFFAMCCGYAFAKGRFVLKKFWYMFMMAVMMIPFESRMIPLYLQYNSWGMVNTYWPLILGNFAYVFGMIFATTNISALPDALRESACLDGASEWTIFSKIILPLSKPVISALAILQTVAQWNSYLWPMVILRNRDLTVLTVGISLFNAEENNMYLGPRMAVAALSAVPLIIVFLFLQKYIVESVAMTGIKQ